MGWVWLCETTLHTCGKHSSPQMSAFSYFSTAKLYYLLAQNDMYIYLTVDVWHCLVYKT